jgi:hypothetical protein
MDAEVPADDRERRLIDAVVSLAKSFREERDRLARRLTQLEHEIDMLAVKLEGPRPARPEAAAPDAPPPDPSRTPS